jgi:hypothetical protein
MTQDFILDSKTLYLIYDGECPLCNKTAQAVALKKAVGSIVLISAREEHPLVNEVFAKGLDPDEGVVVVYNHHYYYGKEAVNFLALLEAPSGVVNKLLVSLLGSRRGASLTYPLFKLMRRTLLNIKGVGAVNHHDGQPIFAHVLGSNWDKLSPGMKQRFANRAYTDECVELKGVMTIRRSKWMKMLSPLLKITGALMSQEGEAIPVKVNLRTEKRSARCYYERQFLSAKGPLKFNSYMLHIKENCVVEYMRFGVGWRMYCSLKGNLVLLEHGGYVWRIFNWLVPIPLSLLLGKCNVVETPLSDDSYKMEMTLEHGVWGTIYEYSGTFTGLTKKPQSLR